MLFREREPVGRIRLTHIGDQSSSGVILSGPSGKRVGLTASEYTVATQVVVYRGGILSTLEVVAIIAAVLGYAWSYWRNRGSPLIILGGWCRAQFGHIFENRMIRWVLILLTIVPFVWFLGGLLPGVVAVLIEKAAAKLPGTPLASFAPTTWPWIKAHLWGVYLIGAIVSLGWLLRQKRSPVIAFWDSLAWGPQFYSRLPDFSRNLVIWSLHLAIAYAFASTLFDFLAGNLKAMLANGWPNAEFEFSGSPDMLHPAAAMAWAESLVRLVVFLATHTPKPSSTGAAFDAVKFGLWSITVIGCILGYGHSVLGPLWGKHIRNLDFTIVGWITNAFCYPLLGLAVWRLVPSFVGLDPIVTEGPLFYLVLALGLACNVFYTLSIWNLGTLFGVMTDKGVRTTGYYATVRHPGYTLEFCMFILIELIGFTGVTQWFGIAIYPLIYWLRSEREDVFMAGSNPDYVKYQSATPYKFVPGFYYTLNG